MSSLKVLHISNHSRQKCGIQNFGYQFTTALRRAGAEVVDWDGDYSRIHSLEEQGLPGPVPADVAAYDVVHVNWHPVTLNHYIPKHFREVKLLSVYLHDLPPWSGCPFHDRADVRFASQAFPGCHVLPYPIADWIDDLPPPYLDFTVGWSGVRGDGAAELAEACAALGFQTNAPDGVWRTFEEEVQRLARSTVNVCWYREGRGISGGASQVASARRPMLLNHSSMFAHFWPYEEELYLYREEMNLDTALRQIQQDWENGELRMPNNILTELSWSRAADRILLTWEEALCVSH